MGKAVLISIHPKWCELIANGKKTIEVRKTKPKIQTPFKCYIYCTQSKEWLPDSAKMYIHSSGKVIGEFICDYIETFDDDAIHSFSNEEYSRWNDFDLNRACIHPQDFEEYANDSWLYGWHISELVVYDTPKKLSEFKGRKLVWRGNNHIHEYEEITRPPQSWCYVKGREQV